MIRMSMNTRPIDGDTQSTRGLRSIARTWFWFILLGTIVGVGAAFLISAVTPATYTARVSLLIIPSSPSGSSTPITPSDLTVSQALIPTFAELATTTPVLTGAITAAAATTNPQALAQAVTTHVPTNTNILDISVSDRDPAQAAALANAIADQLRNYSPPDSNDASVGSLVQLSKVDPATPPTVKDGPGLLVRLALGGAIALFLTVSIAFLGENLSRGRELIRRSSGPGVQADPPNPDPITPRAEPDSSSGPYAMPAWWRRARAAQSTPPPNWPPSRAGTVKPESAPDPRGSGAPRDAAR